MIEVTSELLVRHDQPDPRYTSYPTAQFTEAFGRDDYAEHLGVGAGRADQPLSANVHLPFCEARCFFCVCHVVVTKRVEVSDDLDSETDLVSRHLGDRGRLIQYHSGVRRSHRPPTRRPVPLLEDDLSRYCR